MNTLDSRSLGVGDCFAMKFAGHGPSRYLLSRGVHAPTTVGPKDGFPIVVNPKRDPAAAAKQHYVQVKSGAGGLAPATEELAIEAGDTVLWYTTDAAAAGFSVAGAGEKLVFGSHKLTAEAIYTHAFGLPGTYEWTDPLARHVSGTVVVKAVTPRNDKEMQAWLDSLSKGASFEIRGGKVTPEKVEIVVGQTVFWKAWDGDGLAVVDKRLLG